MIRLSKGDEPAVLSNNAAVWTAELLDALEHRPADVPGIKGRYNHPTVKAALKAETSEKCAYCESKMLHVTFGDIEHIVPKSADPKLTFDWENLTLACDVCNTKKGTARGY
ncbi:HNH endonuclease [Novosphingobium pokkalii]|uniref:HNH endonuclease n=1 Tax=Novosphingobium pokkalii TaxID=1770194 RepID=UPI0036321047